MPRDPVELVEEYAGDDPGRWAKLASTVQWRRLQLLLLRQIVIELRNLIRAVAGARPPDEEA